MCAVAALGDEDRIAHIRAKRWIDYPHAARVLWRLEELYVQPRSDRMENLLLLGRSGMGKTMLIRKFARQVTLDLGEPGIVRLHPVVVMLMPHDPTAPRFFTQLLRAIGVPSADSCEAIMPREATILRLLSEVGVKVIVIDELNSVLAGTARQQRCFLQLLRWLSNELRVALVGVGVPETRHALMSDDQLRSRFMHLELPDWQEGEPFTRFVTQLIWSLPLRAPSRVNGRRLTKLLLGRTGGITLGVCKVIERAAIAAIRSGQEHLDLSAFERDEVWDGVDPGLPPLSVARRTVRVRPG
ncbi:TniB family NTP-binding protein [Gluconacetobacter sacchari]|uniref:TniB family NTP-binding protein n=1 Tax=Gluconacetobacter sacchari TaxID=92759 RepID=A0A7W4IGX4_9PROT|nr:TniB family NTP-binding protein [Gluconacetobacter sacchari]